MKSFFVQTDWRTCGESPFESVHRSWKVYSENVNLYSFSSVVFRHRLISLCAFQNRNRLVGTVFVVLGIVPDTFSITMVIECMVKWNFRCVISESLSNVSLDCYFCYICTHCGIGKQLFVFVVFMRLLKIWNVFVKFCLYFCSQTDI